MKKHIQLLYFVLILFVYNSCNEETTFDESLIKDGSGNIYTEIQIGEQIWLKEDLATKLYNDGSVVLYREDKGSEGFYYKDWLNDFDRICPVGYRVPTQNDFEKLITYFGGYDLNESEIIEAYVKTWNGNPNGNGGGIFNVGSGLYWTSSKKYKDGFYYNYYFYFRTENAGISVSRYGATSLHIKCIKKIK